MSSKTEFIKGQRVIYHSGIGYDLGRFHGENQNQYEHYDVIIETGMFRGQTMSLPKSNIIPETKENLQSMFDKYGKVI